MYTTVKHFSTCALHDHDSASYNPSASVQGRITGLDRCIKPDALEESLWRKHSFFLSAHVGGQQRHAQRHMPKAVQLIMRASLLLKRSGNPETAFSAIVAVNHLHLHFQYIDSDNCRECSLLRQCNVAAVGADVTEHGISLDLPATAHVRVLKYQVWQKS